MNIRHHTLLQHTMKFSTNGLNNEGATIIEYVTPSISEAEKLCLADIHENIEEDMTSRMNIQITNFSPTSSLRLTMPIVRSHARI